MVFFSPKPFAPSKGKCLQLLRKVRKYCANTKGSHNLRNSNIVETDTQLLKF